MKDKTYKRVVSLLLAFFMLAGVVVAGMAPAYAADQLESHNFSFPRAEDASYANSDSWGRPEQNLMSGWYSFGSDLFWVHTVGEVEGTITYCIEPGVSRPAGETFSRRDETFWDNYPEELNATIKPNVIKDLLGRIMQYGYQGKVSKSWLSQNEADADKIAQIIATQMLVWETVVGERDAGFNHVSTGDRDPVMLAVKNNHPLRDRIMKFYNSIETSVQNHTVLPSFMTETAETTQTTELKWDGNRYSAELVDSNRVIDRFSFSSESDAVRFEQSGNRLTVYSDEPISAPVTISAERTNKRCGVIVWSDGKSGQSGGYQDVITYGESISDSVKAYMKVNTKAGGLEIVKTSEDGNIEGIAFVISGNGFSQTVTTGEDGTIKVDGLTAGTYTVTETTPKHYEAQQPKTVEIKENQTAQIKFENKLKRGELLVTKTAEDGLIEGVEFRLYGTSSAGEQVDILAKTNSEGAAVFKDVPVGSGYTVEEVNTSAKYYVPESQSVAIEWNEVTEVGFENHLKHGAVQLTKVDEEYPENKLTGAEFEVFADRDDDRKFNAEKDEFIGMMEETEPGIYQMNGLSFGGYFVSEKTAPDGFLKDDGYYFFEISEDGMTVNVENEAGVGFVNKARSGSIRIEKTSDDGMLQGFTFKVEGKDICGNLFSKEYVTDENGRIVIEGLRLGEYTISEVSNEASAKYVLPEDVVLEVKVNETAVAEFHNRTPKEPDTPDSPEIPKTGDVTNMPLLAAITIVSITCAGVAAFVTFRKKRKGDAKHDS